VPDASAKPPVGDDAAAVAGQRMGCPAGAGDGAGGMQARPVKPRLQIVAQIRFAAKEMRHARDIGHQTINVPSVATIGA
jgi:hypothetical protein